MCEKKPKAGEYYWNKNFPTETMYRICLVFDRGLDMQYYVDQLDLSQGNPVTNVICSKFLGNKATKKEVADFKAKVIKFGIRSIKKALRKF